MFKFFPYLYSSCFNKIIFKVVFCCLSFIYISSELTAQEISNLPRLSPSYSEDFSDYNSFPSMCISDVHFDNNGKLWLQVCSAGRVTNAIHLFQFDGYDFRLVKEPLDQLNNNAKFVDLYQGNKLVGFVDNQDGIRNQLFFFDLQIDQLQTYSYEDKGVIRDLRISEDERMFLIFERDQKWISYEWLDGELIEQFNLSNFYSSTDSSINYSLHFLFQDEKSCWFRSLNNKKQNNNQNLNLVINKTGEIKTFHTSDFEDYDKDKKDRGFRKEFQLLYADELYASLSLDRKAWKLYYLNAQGNRFLKVNWVPEDWASNGVFKDNSGNIVFLFMDAGGQYQAILQDIDGKKFNYSDFFSTYTNFGISKVNSNDFKKQIIICSSKGISLHKVKASEAIQQFLISHSIRAMVEMPDQQFIVLTQRAGTYFRIDSKTGKVSPEHIADCNFGWTTLIPDSKGNIWTYDTNNIIKYNPNSKTCESYAFPGINIRLFTFIDDNEIAIIDGDNRLSIFNIHSKSSHPFMEGSEHKRFPGFINDILYGQNGWLWIGGSNGLFKIDLKNYTSEEVSKNEGFLDSRIICLNEDRNGRLWIGTALAGLHIFDPLSKDLKIINNKDGLINNTIAHIIEDDEGLYWLGTYNGISVVSSEGELITNIALEDGLVEREHNRYSNLKAKDGKLLMGTVNGLNIIDPKNLKEQILQFEEPLVYLTQIEYYDQKSDKQFTQNFGLNHLEPIHLSASGRNLNLTFASSEYFNLDENQFAFMLEGVDDDWTYIGNQRRLNLTNLPAGNYNMLIKSSNGLGKWSKKPVRISIQADAYFYKQPWFYFLIILFLGGIAFLWIFRLRQAVQNATQEIQKDKAIIEKQTKKLLELDKAKSQFFTNISHEFRTPLTIISGMIDQVMSKPDLWLKKGGDMIKQNAANLLSLVNQILDLRKLESKNMELNLIQGDVIQYLRYITESYKTFAESKGIQLHFLSESTSLIMDYDPDKLLRVISNLLSNAIKFSADKGNIYFQLYHEVKDNNQFLQIKIKDSGSGIAEDQLEEIFNRFYQVDSSLTRKGEGTGIGLALTKELVHLMKGEIFVESTLGTGTTFKIKLPVTRLSSVGEEFAVLPIEESITDSTLVSKEHPQSSVLPKLLIVEDNPDVSQFLIACLQDEYQLSLAANGQEGIDIAIDQIPDLIISDVMMPIKDGFELCDTLKQDEITSHIPIILLTAKADLDSKIVGLERGADAYLNKPFEQSELLVRIKKLLELRKSLQQRYLSMDFVQTKQDLPTNQEDVFLNKIKELVEENISDDSFGNVQLAHKMNLSESQLYRKIKALTDKSTAIFIRSIRLHKAKILLKNTDLTISEIAYDVGFSDPAYFSRSFSKEFGQAPNTMRK